MRGACLCVCLRRSYRSSACPVRLTQAAYVRRLDTASDWSFRSAQAGSVSCRESALRMSESELSFKRLSCSSDHEPLTFAGWSSGWTRLRHGRFVPRIGGTKRISWTFFRRKPWKLGRQFWQDGLINSPSLAVLPRCGRERQSHAGKKRTSPIQRRGGSFMGKLSLRRLRSARIPRDSSRACRCRCTRP